MEATPNILRAMHREPVLRHSPDCQCPKCLPARTKAALPASEPTVTYHPIIVLRISGQIRGGKNNMTVTRSGKHIPKKPWAKWRDAAVMEVSRQLPPNWSPINSQVKVGLEYVSGDLRRRDQPAILDSIFHVLEKAGVVRDDTLIWVNQSTRSHDKDKAGATITIELTTTPRGTADKL